MTVVREAQVDPDLAQAALGVEDVIERCHEPSANVILVDRHTDDIAEHVREMKWGTVNARRERGERPANRRLRDKCHLRGSRNVGSARGVTPTRASLRSIRRSSPRALADQLGRGLFGFQGVGQLPQETVTQETPAHDDAR
jgi:hypothetical protein